MYYIRLDDHYQLLSMQLMLAGGFYFSGNLIITRMQLPFIPWRQKSMDSQLHTIDQVIK